MVFLIELQFLFIFINVFQNIVGDNVFGCGGFVKSDVDINYSLVEVKLYTTHGSIKYQTDCAPNTGYYLIPLYDKGDFILKVEPPTGWSFEPESIELHIDGTTDKCSLGQDINFHFTGFSVQGKVISRGQEEGPSGVTVTLSSAGAKDALRTTTTLEGGKYTFVQVQPGDYIIRASQATWTFEQSEAKLQLSSDNGDVGSSIVIAGYDVTGRVFSDGDPVKGVNFILFSKIVEKDLITGCDKSAIKGFTNPEKPLCHVTSAENGQFKFPALPTGVYSLVPYYKGEHITFDVVPAKMEFAVKHGSLELEPTFKVAGFSVSGKVLDSPKGSGVPNAKVLLNGKEQTTTGADGSYHLENMKTGSYSLQIQALNVFFNAVEVKITPNTPHLPDIVAVKYSLCGRVVIDKVPEGLSQVSSTRRIIIFPEGKSSEAVSIATDVDGSFCTEVEPGNYVIKVHLTEVEVRAGLHLSPTERTVSVTTKPVVDIIFSQFKAKVTGTVNCMEKCGMIEVSLTAVGRSDMKQIVQVKEVNQAATFAFENVLPGKYKVTLLQDSWCWKSKMLEIEVLDQNLGGVDFIQTGYILKCSISHEISLNFAHEKKEGSVGSFQLNKGTNRFCLAQPGVYRLIPDSCHKFEKDIYTYDTSNPEMLTLTAVKHLLNGVITTEERVSDIIVAVRSSTDATQVLIGPLVSDKEPEPEKKDAKTGNETKPNSDLPIGPFNYAFSHWARSGEKLEFSVKSRELLFSPGKIETVIHGDTCPGEVAKFTGKRGMFIEGQISPALADVNITVVTMDGALDPVSIVTDGKGQFRIGPLHSNLQYEVMAEKDGYVLAREEGQLAKFKAYKLGEISVEVVAEADAPLSNVLLSLSGGRQYRSNNVTGDNGTMIFSFLTPGQYFLRPMMKEYKFEPASQMVDVLEGTTMKIKIVGFQVAYSGYGQVTSLNGEPEPGVIIEAVGQGNCSVYQEESKTDQEGLFRIRGLEPKCTYDLHLKTGDLNKHIERAVPKSHLVTVEKADVTGMNIIAFRRMNQMDISGNIVTQQEYLSTLKIKLYREDDPDTAIHTVHMGATTFFYLPSLQIDNSNYLLRMDSMLSKTSYEYSSVEVSFVADISYRHFTFNFEPRRKSLEQELNQGSFLILPLTLLVILIAYNHQKLKPYLLQLISQVQTVLNKQVEPTPPQEPVHIDTYLGKKKLKPRKT
ncbi:hypothetical protein ScPMuIL_003458 [Solemya velum]